MEFVTVPGHYVLDKKLIVFDRYFKAANMYVYDSELNEWMTVKINSELSLNISDLWVTIPITKFKAASLSIGEYNSFMRYKEMCK